MTNRIPPRQPPAAPPQGGTGGKIVDQTPPPKLKIDPKVKPADDEFHGPIGKIDPDPTDGFEPNKP